MDEKFLTPLEETLRGIAGNINDPSLKKMVEETLLKLAGLRSIYLSQREILQFKTQLELLAGKLRRKGFGSAAGCLEQAIKTIF
jgi:hypothetical protein